MIAEDEEEPWRAAEERQWRADWLQALGVPAPFHDAIIDAHDRLTAPGGQLLGLAVVGIPIAVATAAMVWLQLHVIGRATALAGETGALLAHVSVGIGPLVLFFSSLGFVGVLALLFDLSAIAGRYQGNSFPNRAAALINSPPDLSPRATRWMLRASVQHAAAKTTTVEAFLRSMARHQARKWGIGAMLFAAPALLLTFLESNSYWVAGPTGIVEHRILPPFSSRRYDLAGATAVITGCSDMSNRLVYEIQVGSGERFSLGSTRPIAGTRTAAIERIDAGLGRTIEHRRWSHLDRSPVHPACLGYWASQFDKDGLQRLARLLRLTQDELRGLH